MKTAPPCIRPPPTAIKDKPGSPGSDRPQAALEKLQAEEEAAHVRSLQPYLDYFNVDLPYDVEPSIAMQSAKWLRDLGFDTVWEGPNEDGSVPSMWEKLDKDVVDAGRKSYGWLTRLCCLWWRWHF